MKYPSLLTGFVIFLSLGAAYGMDELPKEILEHQILPKLDAETLENFGNTSKANAEAVNQVRENLGIPKKAKLSCPSKKETAQALGMDGSEPTHVTINGISWVVKAIKLKSLNTTEWLKDAALKKVFVSSSSSRPTYVLCRYEHGKTWVLLERALQYPDFKILPNTCKPLNPADQKKVQIIPPAGSVLAYTFKSIADASPFPDGLVIMCDQEKN